MISEKYSCIFVHVPKTAGQSIENFFLGLHGLKWKERAPLLLRYNPDPSKGPHRLAHLKASEYLSYGYVEPETFRRYFKFSFVRNPWDRLVSEYRFLQLEERVPFREFVEQSFSTIDNDGNASLHITPQVGYLTDQAGEYLVDFVGRFETLEADFAQVAQTLDLSEARLSHRNVSGEGKMARLYRRVTGRKPNRDRQVPYQSYYSNQLRERVTAYYAEDIERFGYCFDGSFAPEHIIIRNSSG